MLMRKNFFFILTIGVTILACEDILEEVDISGRRVTVLAPLDNTVLTSNEVNFNWDAVEDADFYRFQLAKPDFVSTQQVVSDSIIEIDSLGYGRTQVKFTLLNGNYTWRVKAVNSGFETPYQVNSFRVQGDEDIDVISPNTPQLVAPANGFSQAETRVDFSWVREDISGTAEFDSIFFFVDENLSKLLSKDIGANKSYSATVAQGTYYWYVKAYDTAGNESENSEVFSFTLN